jgi:glycosyltransferase involved in cell wall biosynthesis
MPGSSPTNPTLGASPQDAAVTRGVSASPQDGRIDRRPLRLLLWSLAGSGEHYNGVGVMFHRMFRKVDPRRLEVTLVHGSPEQVDSGPYRRYVRLPGSSSRLGQIRFLMHGRRWLARHAGEFDAMLAVSAFETSSRPAWLAQTRFGLPAAIFLANEKIEFAERTGIRRLLQPTEHRRRMVRELAAVVCMSETLELEARSIGVTPSRIARIPNVIDTDRFAPTSSEARGARRAELGLPPGPVVVFCGELTPRKRPHLVIEASIAAHRAGRPFSILLVGPPNDAAYAARLADLVREHPEPNRVQMVGFTREPERYYAASDLFVLPSSNEGMPGALVEAMACGLPAIVTPFSSARELVRDGVLGSVIEPDVAALEAAVAHWTLDRGRWHAASAAARASAESRHGIAASLDRYEALFRRMMSTVGPRPSLT